MKARWVAHMEGTALRSPYRNREPALERRPVSGVYTATRLDGMDWANGHRQRTNRHLHCDCADLTGTQLNHR